MKKLVMLSLATLCACGAEVPTAGKFANGSFTFSASSGSAQFDLPALSIDSRQGVIAVGTTRDLRIIRGDKVSGFSEPNTIELTPQRPAEVNGVSVSDDGTHVFAGYSGGVAVVELSTKTAVLLPLDAPVAQLYRTGTTLFLVSFANVLTTVSVEDVATPKVLGALSLEGGLGTVRSATFTGSKATFSAEGMLWVVDVSDPANLALVASHALEGFVGSSVRGPAHVFTGNTGKLSVLEMPDDRTAKPAGPEKSVWRLPSAAPVLHGSRLYLFDEQRGFLFVVDVGFPTQPVLLTYLKSVTCTASPRASVLDADGVLWVVCPGGAANYVIDF